MVHGSTAWCPLFPALLVPSPELNPLQHQRVDGRLNSDSMVNPPNFLPSVNEDKDRGRARCRDSPEEQAIAWGDSERVVWSWGQWSLCRNLGHQPASGPQAELQGQA